MITTALEHTPNLGFVAAEIPEGGCNKSLPYF